MVYAKELIINYIKQEAITYNTINFQCQLTHHHSLEFKKLNFFGVNISVPCPVPLIGKNLRQTELNIKTIEIILT